MTLVPTQLPNDADSVAECDDALMSFSDLCQAAQRSAQTQPSKAREQKRVAFLLSFWSRRLGSILLCGLRLKSPHDVGYKYLGKPCNKNPKQKLSIIPRLTS